MDTTNLDLNKVDLDALKANLKEAEVTFGGRSGPQRLVDLAIENDLAIPLIGGEDFDPDAEPDEEEAGGNVIAVGSTSTVRRPSSATRDSNPATTSRTAASSSRSPATAPVHGHRMPAPPSSDAGASHPPQAPPRPRCPRSS